MKHQKETMSQLQQMEHEALFYESLTDVARIAEKLNTTSLNLSFTSNDPKYVKHRKAYENLLAAHVQQVNVLYEYYLALCEMTEKGNNV
jgi:hypothetical protein